MLRLITTYPLEALFAFYVFSNLVGAMPKPESESGPYAMLYRFAHGLAGNVRYALRARFGDGFLQPDGARSDT